MDSWTEVAKKPTGKKKHRYSEQEAQRIEKMADCRFLAPALRSHEVEQLFADGWQYAWVRKKDDDAVPETGFIYMSITIKNNPWGDLLVLRKLERARSSNREYD